MQSTPWQKDFLPQIAMVGKQGEKHSHIVWVDLDGGWRVS